MIAIGYDACSQRSWVLVTAIEMTCGRQKVAFINLADEWVVR